MKIKTQKGFTLIELLVVISVLGMLAAVILVSLNTARSKARDSKRVLTLNQISKALDLYYNVNNSYPNPHDDYTPENWNGMMTQLASSGYITQADLDQFNSGGFQLIPVAQASYSEEEIRRQDPLFMATEGEYAYGYMPSASPAYQGYRLRAKLENLNHPALSSGIAGIFIDNGVTTGNASCDKSLGYYCVGSTASTASQFTSWY